MIECAATQDINERTSVNLQGKYAPNGPITHYDICIYDCDHFIELSLEDAARLRDALHTLIAQGLDMRRLCEGEEDEEVILNWHDALGV